MDTLDYMVAKLNRIVNYYSSESEDDDGKKQEIQGGANHTSKSNSSKLQICESTSI